MKIAILGYGRQGQSAASYWEDLNRSNEITICDQNTTLEVPAKYLKKLGPKYLEHLKNFDLIVRSPSIHPASIVKSNAPEILEKVTSTTNEFMKVCPTKNIIGVTGTKGKGTTSTLIAKILEAAGFTVHLGGNIGLDPLLLLKDNIGPKDWVVLELANFQLIDLKQSPKIAICLTFTPEHLDWHEDTEEYLAAKQQLFINQHETDKAIYYAKNKKSLSIADASIGELIPFMEEPGATVKNNAVYIAGNKIIDTKDIKLIGEHNWQNICAAITAVWQITNNKEAIKKAIENFRGLPHRIEMVREIYGISFYNDSFATAQGATVAAINAIKKNKVLILGGYDRGMDLSELFSELDLHKSDISCYILIGQTAGLLAREMKKRNYKNYKLVTAKTIGPAVSEAYKQAKQGEAIIFSPSFASFDMFKDFEDRGNKFKSAVMDL